MRIKNRGHRGIVEGDLTPMIDMTFQLIAFFMLVINFSDVEQDQRVTLPASELATPPVAPYEHPLTIHLTDSGDFLYAGRDLTSTDSLRAALVLESQIIQRHTTKSLADVTVIIRADEDARTGNVQKIIDTCQDLKFERFALRGKQSEVPTLGKPE
ncbi:ExbD/TolR family protein [Adhaeretor mobilis]|uniref:Biopolymer transport protein ExbD n=1 Tax=Adhaeretor mobilis TaxID=1930276 RepID=A0A517MYR0_9BACT|nr:biopolymer transporter ExbD [Adhaeretor mobilis]QDT00029.1 biopolymer transport protein ExbD [Adhaeretor mobilis]